MQLIRALSISILFVSVALSSRSAFAQSIPNPEVGRAAMAKLSSLIGRWEGEATIMLGPGRTIKVKQTEVVQKKLDGGALLIEGTGRDAAGTDAEKIVFQALAVCNYDPISKKYKFHAFRDNGMSIVADAELTDTGFIWGFEDGRGGKIRYTVTLKDDTWSEIGEYLIEGQPARKTFEMTVKRISETRK